HIELLGSRRQREGPDESSRQSSKQDDDPEGDGKLREMARRADSAPAGRPRTQARGHAQLAVPVPAGHLLPLDAALAHRQEVPAQRESGPLRGRPARRELRPLVLAERWRTLSRLAMAKLESPDKFWRKLETLPTVAANLVPESAIRALDGLLPAKGLAVRYVHRTAGAGSLGRQRFVALADWRGGNIAREAKAAAKSGFLWSHRGDVEPRAIYREILNKAVRCQDPFLSIKRRWIVRR